MKLRRLARLAGAFALLASWACGSTARTPSDAGLAPSHDADAGSADANASDAGTTFDAGLVRDGGAGASDAGTNIASADDAALVSHDLPTTMRAGESVRATLVFANRGTSTWTRALGYKLGGVDDSDPFADARVELPSGVSVAGAPGSPGTHAFTVQLVAPTTPGTYVTDWRMLRERVRWFGETASQTIEVRAVEGCTTPLPPPVDRLRVVVHADQGFRKVLDSTALVRGQAYCAEVGFTDGRLYCPTRPEGHPEVDACNELSVGRASDTGRVGPTWTYRGAPCDNSASSGSCKNHPANQFLVFVHGPGTARACTAAGVCGEVTVP